MLPCKVADGAGPLFRIRRLSPCAERPSSASGEGPLSRWWGMTAHQYSGRGGGPLAPPSSSPGEAAGRAAGGAEDWGGAAEGADGASEAEKGIGAVGAVVG